MPLKCKIYCSWRSEVLLHLLLFVVGYLLRCCVAYQQSFEKALLLFADVRTRQPAIVDSARHLQRAYLCQWLMVGTTFGTLLLHSSVFCIAAKSGLSSRFVRLIPWLVVVKLLYQIYVFCLLRLEPLTKLVDSSFISNEQKIYRFLEIFLLINKMSTKISRRFWVT